MPNQLDVSMNCIVPALRRSLPWLLAACWLLYVAWAIWQHVQASGQPLVFDALTYWLKARSVWQCLAEGRWGDIFAAEPTTRPPGTVLMSYPFGFDESPKGFLFRSVFLGIALTFLAVLVVGRAMPRSATRAWQIVSVALFLCALPMFYHFEWSRASGSPDFWGLTDSFLAGLAALSASAAIYGAIRESWIATALSALLASLCFLTKPAGILIVGTVSLAWFVVAIVHGSATRRGYASMRRDLLRLCGGGVAVFVGVCGPVLLVGFRSAYFSSKNIAYGNRALEMLTASTFGSLSLAKLHGMVRSSFGDASVIAFAALALCGIAHVRAGGKSFVPSERALVIGGLTTAGAFLGTGLWFWVLKTGGYQIRYGYPFALMAAIAMLPVAFLALDRASRAMRLLVLSVLLVPSINIAALLGQASPSHLWQKIVGVNLTVHPVSSEASLGSQVLDAARHDRRSMTVYDMSDEGAGAVDAVWRLERIRHPDGFNITATSALDWERTPVVRLAEIVDADFVLFDKETRADRDRHLHVSTVDTYDAEAALFRAWFSTLGAAEGVESFADTEVLQMLRVVERSRLHSALERLKASKRWRPEFVRANPQVWWNEQEVAAESARTIPAASNVGFGGLFRVRAVAVQQAAGVVELKLWWIHEEGPPRGQWFFFAHLIDPRGAILSTVSIPLLSIPSYVAGHPFRFDSLSVPVPVGVRPEKIAFGIYRAESGRADALPADSGRRDWNNQRVVVPVEN
jgi:hypothetical protein